MDTEACIDVADWKDRAGVVAATQRIERIAAADPAIAGEVGAGKFPPESAALIAAVVERDARFYDPVISEAAVRRLNGFAQSIGHLSAPVPYDHVVATRCRRLWTNG